MINPTRADVAAFDQLRPPYPFRIHQEEALAAIDAARTADRRRAWVVLPPGAGKTLVGLETIRRAGRRAVVFGPNTAIQEQWRNQWNRFVPDGLLATGELPGAGTDRTLDNLVTALTYQSLATFDADRETDEEGGEGGADGEGGEADGSLLDRLHPNGAALVDELRAVGPLTLVLDECHHLLEVWGRLLGELLESLPDVYVLGLTATPPATLTPDQAALVGTLFGETVYETSIPAVVRTGDLAPFAELAWLTTPTTAEADWLGAQAERFTEFTTRLSDPAFGSVPFLEWLDRRYVIRDDRGHTRPWSRLERDDPDLAAAALRMHHAGMLQLPPGARLREEHRHDPTAADWVSLLDDWLRHCLLRSGEAGDAAVVEEVRQVLPAVGFQWTRNGIRRGRSPVDRVLARSAAKTFGAVEIVATEREVLAERLRILVLCDYERATATVPGSLDGVLSTDAGSARLALARLVGDDRTADLNPVLVTGSTVAAAEPTARAILEHVRTEDPALAARLTVSEPDPDGVSRVEGRWTSGRWVRSVTRFFDAGHCQVLVGTRGLLGEGWDARCVTGLIDLTAATTATAMVQTRGRALRIDPGWQDKVAITWTVVCVSERHPGGGNDWDRFVRKHRGFFGTDDRGEIVDGVAQVDPDFSPYAAPVVAGFAGVNARMLTRTGQRDETRRRWRIGTGYDDRVVHTLRLRPARHDAASAVATTGSGPEPEPAPAVVVTERGLERRGATPSLWRPALPAVLAGAPLVLLGVLLLTFGVVWPAALVLVLAGLATPPVLTAGRRGRELIAAAARKPSTERVARAVADGLLAGDLSPAGADAVRVLVQPDGEYRCFLGGVSTEVSERFAVALEEVVSPMASPRYVLPRWLVDPPAPGLPGWWTGLRAATGLLRPSGVVWHSVPSVLGVNARGARAFAEGWRRWIGGGDPVYTGNPEGAGVLATHRGNDPFDVTTVLRLSWQ